MPGYVYILASRRNGTLYIGATNNVWRRVGEHRAGLVPGFTNKYHVHLLVHVERYQNIREARARERQLKKWERKWKIELIEANNPMWRDLLPDDAAPEPSGG